MSYSLYINKKTYVNKDNVSIPGLEMFNKDDGYLIVSETIFDFYGWDFSERILGILEDEDRGELDPSEVIELYETFCDVQGVEVDQSIITKIRETKMGFGQGECFFEYIQSY